MRLRTVLFWLVFGGAAAGGIWAWRSLQTGNAANEPITVSPDEIAFLHDTDAFLSEAAASDKLAAARGHFPAVRQFASNADGDHQTEIEQLKTLAAKIAPNEILRAPRVPDDLQDLKGSAFDRKYLDDFIEAHNKQQQGLKLLPLLRHDSPLFQFASGWQQTLQRHLTEARTLRDGLPRVASNMPLLLMTGVLFVIASLIMRRYRRAGHGSPIRLIWSFAVGFVLFGLATSVGRADPLLHGTPATASAALGIHVESRAAGPGVVIAEVNPDSGAFDLRLAAGPSICPSMPLSETYRIRSGAVATPVRQRLP